MIRKNSIKKRLYEIIFFISKKISVYAESSLTELIGIIESEIDNIEPYDNNDDLTEAQEEKMTWLEETLDYLNEALEYVGDNNFDDAMDCIYQIDI